MPEALDPTREASNDTVSHIQPRASMQSLALTVMLTTLFTLVCLAPLAYTAYRHRPAAVAVVDLQKLVEEDRQRTFAALGKTANGVASEEQRSAYLKSTTDFAHKLEVAIDVVAKQCRCVLVNKAAVLGGESLDYTDGVRSQLGRP